jgi:hypothetical protein
MFEQTNHGSGIPISKVAFIGQRTCRSHRILALAMLRHQSGINPLFLGGFMKADG